METYIFDLDGTLADSMPIAVELVLKYLEEYGISYPDDIVDVLMPLGFRGISEYYEKTMGVPKPAKEIFEDFQKRLLTAYAEVIPLKEGVKQTLVALKERGARLNVLTASPHTFTDACLKRGGVFELFENVWSSEDFGLLKSNPQIYRKVAEALDVDVPACTMVDDNVIVLQTAKSVGMKTVGVYDRFSEEKEVRASADVYVYTFDEILSKNGH
jgi:HAD superfamily hydrolase (TIGR01509 family)